MNPTVKALAYDGVLPSMETARDGSYSLSRFLRMFTHGESAPAALDFIDYVLSEEFQMDTVAREYIPVFGLETR